MRATRHGNSVAQWVQETFGPLEDRVFRRIWFAGSSSYIGTMVQTTAAAWLLTTMTNSAFTISLAQAAATVPFVCFALISGACADTFDRRKQMLFGTLVSLGGVVALTTTTWLGLVTPWMVLALIALIATGTIAFTPAWQASVIDIVQRKHLTAAISLNNLSFNVARCTGPAIGAEIILLAGAAAAFLTNAISYLLMIGVLLSWKRKKEPRPFPNQRLATAIRDGIQFVLLSPDVRVTLARAGLLGFSAATVLAMPPVLILELDAGARGLGILLSAFGIGAMIGSLSLAIMRKKFSTDSLVISNVAILAAALAIASFSTNLILTSASFLVLGFSWIQSMVTLQVSLQTSCPRWVAGRAISIFSMLLSLGLASGATFWGWLATQIGVQSTLLASAVALLIIGILFRMAPFKQLEAEKLETSAILRPAHVPDVDPQSGPIRVTIEYTVAPKNRESFRKVMQEIERIRTRDGARNWSLSVDIDHPEVWSETFESPTWGDYLRRAARRLVSDDQVHEALLASCTTSPKRRRTIIRPPGAREVAELRSSVTSSDAGQSIPWERFMGA